MKISAGLGLTINLGSGEFYKPDIRYTDIDTDLDIDEQLEMLGKVTDKVVDYMHAKLIAQVERKISYGKAK